ncbi:MAG: right-handed parallel beta-helix repeat-containing protein [Thermofilaceae archaeon]
MSREAWIPTFNGKGRHLGHLEFAELAGRMPPTLNADFLVYQEDGVVKGKDLRTGKEYGPSQSLSAVLNAIISSTAEPMTVLIGPGEYTCDQPVELRQGVRIIGSGRRETIIHGQFSVPTVGHQNDIVLKDMMISRYPKQGPGLLVKGDYPAEVTHHLLLIEDVAFYSCTSGVEAYAMSEAVLRGAIFVECDVGLNLADACMNVRCEDLYAVNCGTGVRLGRVNFRCEGTALDRYVALKCSTALQIDDGFLIRVTDSAFDMGTGDTPLLIMGGGEITVSNTWISSDYAGAGRVTVWPGITDIDGVRFVNCTFAYNKLYGLSIVYDGNSGRRPRRITVENCRFYSNGTPTEGGDMYISNADDVTISNCSFLSTEPPYNLKEELSPSRVLILNSYFAKSTAGLSLVAGANRVHGLTNPPSEACGTATVPAGSTSTTVNHNLGFSPKIIRVTPLDNLGGRSFWVSDVTGTSFRINISSTDTVNHAFAWEAEVGWV